MKIDITNQLTRSYGEAREVSRDLSGDTIFVLFSTKTGPVLVEFDGEADGLAVWEIDDNGNDDELDGRCVMEKNAWLSMGELGVRSEVRKMDFSRDFNCLTNVYMTDDGLVVSSFDKSTLVWSLDRCDVH